MLSNWSAAEKAKLRIIICVIIVLSISIIQLITVLACIFAFMITTIILASKRTHIKFKTIAAVILFSSVMGTIQALSLGNDKLYEINLKLFTLQLYEEGINKGITTFLKVSCSMYAVILLMRTIRLGEFIGTLKWLKVPNALLEVMTFAVKFIYIFKDETSTVIKAQKSRLGYKGFYRTVTSMSSVAGIVLTRAYDRSKVLSKSMRSRGYNGNT